MSYVPGRLYNVVPAADAQNQIRGIQHGSDSVPTFGTNNTQPSHFTSSPSSVELPRIGHHRCYWTLLSTTDLRFIYLDPVLQFHLEEQASELINRSLLEFIHPDEQATARDDLGQVIGSKNFHGSITRTRFCRLSRVRRMLGHDGPPPSFPSAEKVILDANYMAVDIVLNYAAEGLGLCFIHATVDIDPATDNDKTVKSPWTNWCGTPFMAQEQLQLLSRQLQQLDYIPQNSHDRVFQMLDNGPGRTLLLSWPPDGTSFSAQDFATLAHTVNLSEPNAEAKTNCTRRYQHSRDLRGAEVFSVYIPHGSVIFACHKLKSLSPSPSSAHTSTTSTASIPDATVAAMGYNASTTSSYPLPPPHTQQPSSYYDQQHYTLPSLSSSSLHYSYTPPSQQQSNSVSAHYSAYSNWNSQPPAHPAVQSLRNGYWTTPPTGYESSQGAPLSLSGPPQTHDNYRPLSPGYSAYNSTPNASGGADHLSEHGSPMSSSPPADVVPPPRRRVSPGNPREYNRGENAGGREGRGHGNRPSGILKCSSCKATTSPEWRKGPSGKKELCNACGLRYARSRAKKEGHVPSSGSRRRKDKILKRDTSPPTSTPSPASSGTPSSYAPPSSAIPYQAPSTPPYGSGSSVRRSYPGSYEDSSFSSAGSAGSGSDIYVSHRSAGTPSPSPPAGTSSFVSYSAGSSESHGHRAGYYGSSVPSPLASNPPSMLPSQSFERESHRDGGTRDPQTPVSAEPKHYYETTSLRESTVKYEKKEDRPYERDYRAYERDERGRGLVSG